MANASLLQPWRQAGVDAVCQYLHQCLERDGAAAMDAWRELLDADVAQHIDCLDLALQCQDAAPYQRHLLWYRDLLARRGMPVHWCGRMTDALRAYWYGVPDCPHAQTLLRLIDLAAEALRSPLAQASFAQNRLAPMAQAQGFREDILQGRHAQAVQCVVHAMDEGATLVQAGVQIVQPALYAVGDLWQHNRISVAQEHLACAISQNALVAAYMKATFLPENGKRALFACVQGNHHVVGLRMVCDAVETQGWDAQFLGADVPTFDLVRMADAQRPDLLCLSASMPEHLAVAKQAIDLLRAELGSACPAIWVGGLAITGAPGAWRVSGADGYAMDAAQVVQELG